MSIGTTRQILTQISHALKFLHSRNYIHCDIKLENVMLKEVVGDDSTERITAKLADFGLAQREAEAQRGGKTGGTLGYLAPEVVAGQPCSTASDIWSLGCLLYAVLTLSLPFSPQQINKLADSLQKLIFKSDEL